mmetsp:Transcript_114481/g.272359  ORF Transcript_114481/g.272359 Transcript_114481/m.272359 type:complete len:302 (+) Transcript_114481:1647-2552(+)
MKRRRRRGKSVLKMIHRTSFRARRHWGKRLLARLPGGRRQCGMPPVTGRHSRQGLCLLALLLRRRHRPGSGSVNFESLQRRLRHCLADRAERADGLVHCKRVRARRASGLHTLLPPTSIAKGGRTLKVCTSPARKDLLQGLHDDGGGHCWGVRPRGGGLALSGLGARGLGGFQRRILHGRRHLALTLEVLEDLPSLRRKEQPRSARLDVVNAQPKSPALLRTISLREIFGKEHLPDPFQKVTLQPRQLTEQSHIVIIKALAGVEGDLHEEAVIKLPRKDLCSILRDERLGLEDVRLQVASR